MDQGWMKEFTGRKKMKGEKRRDERSFSLFSLPYFSKPALFNGIGVYYHLNSLLFTSSNFMLKFAGVLLFAPSVASKSCFVQARSAR